MLCVCACTLSCSIVSDSGTTWTVACQASLSMEFSKQEYWSELLFPTPEYLPDSGIKPVSLVSCIGRWILYHCAIWEASCTVHWL